MPVAASDASSRPVLGVVEHVARDTLDLGVRDPRHPGPPPGGGNVGRLAFDDGCQAG